MAETVQNFKSHARWLPAFHFFMMPVLLVNFLNEVRHLIMQQTLHNAWMVIFAAALLTLGFLSRIQALTVQDRVIRLEMRLRLRGILPPDMHSRIDELSRRPMVAL